MKKNVIITGTSTGVGYEAALLFARKGYKVYATMRNIAKGESLKKIAQDENLDLEILVLDVLKMDTIIKAIDYIIEKDGKVDVFVNNAGAGFAKTIEEATEDEIHWVTETNYLGVVRTIKAVIPQMRKQKFGHIINVTSVGGLVGQPFNELYCGAKFAVEGFTESMATYLSDPFNIKFSIVEPGGITTEFMNSAVSKTIVNGQLATGEYLPIFERYLDASRKRAEESKTSVYQTGVEVAQVILDVMEMENPPLRIRTSQWAEDLCSLKTHLDSSGFKQLEKVRRDFLS